MGRPGMLGSDLSELVQHFKENGPYRVLPAARRVRVIYNNTLIVDTTKALHVWEHSGYPHFYVPLTELKNSSTHDIKTIDHNDIPYAAVVELTVPAAENGISEQKTDRVLRFEDHSALGELAGFVRLEFGAMDQWLEEDTPIYVHPKDPFKRIDTLASSRTIEIRIGGETVAKSSFSVHLHETGLPVRYYLPLGSVNPTVLRHSDLITKCPYKGDAEYYHLVINGATHENIIWYYRYPTQESLAIAGLVCFYNEKVDILLDGELLK